MSIAFQQNLEQKKLAQKHVILNAQSKYKILEKRTWKEIYHKVRNMIEQKRKHEELEQKRKQGELKTIEVMRNGKWNGIINW